MNIYILDINNQIKIGHTKNINKRIKSLQTACETEIKLISLYECVNNKKIEQFVHHVLRDYRSSCGEFFNCSINHMKFVIESCIDLEYIEDQDQKYKIKNLLLENFEIGNNNDFVKK